MKNKDNNVLFLQVSYVYFWTVIDWLFPAELLVK